MKKNNTALKWIYQRTKKFIPGIILTSIINVLISISLIWLASLSKDIIDNSVKHGADGMGLFIVFLFGTIIIQVLLDAALSMLNVRIGGKLTIALRNYMFSRIIHKKYSGVFDHHTGDLLNRFTSDIDQISSGFLGIIPSVCSMLSKIIAGVGALIVQNYIFGIIVLLLGFVFPLIGRFISKRFKYMHKEVQKTEGQARSFLQESFANIVVIKTFVSETPILNKLNEYMNANLKMKLKRNLLTIAMHISLYSFFTFGYYIVMVWGAFQIAVGAISYGMLNYYLQLISILRAPLQNISGIIPQYYSAIASAERLMEIEEIDDEAEPISEQELNAVKESFSFIRVENLTFAYDEELILNNCNFDIERNSITAITGESGCGKSTIFKIILGLYDPDGGSITFNGEFPINASTRPMFAYVPQGNMILSGSIRDNLTLYNPNISEEHLIEATKAAVIYDYIKTLPHGFDTILSERGAGLSEGQIQRLSIARALLFDAPILLFDESTSALDEETETALLSNIKHTTGKTVLFITHRNTSLAVCDRIIHIDT